VEAHLLEAGDVATLREQAEGSAAGGAAAVFVTEGPLGDPFVLAAGLAAGLAGEASAAGAGPELRIGVRLTFAGDSRHPAMLARDATSLDLVCGGRSIVCFAPPFEASLGEVIPLCRALWREGEVVSEGAEVQFPVRAARNRARPAGGGEDSPLVALDLTGGDVPASLRGLVAAVDLVLRPTADPAVCAMERT
jgi:alkanesulfonate monooxygenase SsuD/methylene tetrahydromethanopterin reductase-like flavin-dependent oxidoreductase (luciferase family)